eukprot:4278252-Amphidinium_carterae.1
MLTTCVFSSHRLQPIYSTGNVNHNLSRRKTGTPSVSWWFNLAGSLAKIPLGPTFVAFKVRMERRCIGCAGARHVLPSKQLCEDWAKDTLRQGGHPWPRNALFLTSTCALSRATRMRFGEAMARGGASK